MTSREKAVTWFKKNRLHPSWHEEKYYELWETGYNEAMAEVKRAQPTSAEINEAARLHGWKVSTTFTTASESFQTGITWFKKKINYRKRKYNDR